MPKGYRTAAKSAHLRSDTRVGRSRHACRSISPAMRVALGLWPEKTAINLAAYAGVEVRRAEDWLCGKREPGGPAQIRMIQGEHGYVFLVAFMGEARPNWYRGFLRQIEISELRRAHEETARKLAALERGTLDEELPR